MMNKNLERKLRKGHEKQAEKIRKKACFNRVKEESEIEYQVACEMAKARANAGLTQVEVAAAMETTQSVISRIERGANVSIETLERYASACGHHLKIQVV
jgi:ribosome-binding protein aMBF1 (putative translation factor)